MKAKFTVPYNSGLENGKYYVAYIVVTYLDKNSNTYKESDIQSLGTPFYCFKTPIFNLSISDGTTLTTSNCTVSATYSQENGEKLNYCKFYLYSSTGTVLQSSDEIYEKENLTYIFTGLENKTPYYISAEGETVNRVQLNTGKIQVITSYERASVFSVTEANNLPKIGAIELKSNIVSADAKVTGEITYINGNGVDLTNASAVYDTGYLIENDFSMLFNLKDSKINVPVVTMKSSNGITIEVIPRFGLNKGKNEHEFYYEMVISSGWLKSVLFSSFVPKNAAKVYLYRRNGLYLIDAKEVA